VSLVMHFLRTICQDFGREVISLTRQQCSKLQSHSWPGNVRELRNVIERAVIMTGGNKLRLDLAMGAIDESDAPKQQRDDGSPGFVTESEFREREKRNIEAALRAADWRVWGPDGAAAMLGIKPSTLSYRIKAFGIEKDGAGDSDPRRRPRARTWSGCSAMISGCARSMMPGGSWHWVKRVVGTPAPPSNAPEAGDRLGRDGS